VAAAVATVSEVTAAMEEIEAMAEIAVETAVMVAEDVEEETRTVAGITAEVLNCINHQEIISLKLLLE
jgi:hypothetical protein